MTHGVQRLSFGGGSLLANLRVQLTSDRPLDLLDHHPRSPRKQLRLAGCGSLAGNEQGKSTVRVFGREIEWK